MIYDKEEDNFYERHKELCDKIDNIFMPSIEDLKELREVVYGETDFSKMGIGRRHVFDKAFNLAFESLCNYENDIAVKIYKKVSLFYSFLERIS